MYPAKGWRKGGAAEGLVMAFPRRKQVDGKWQCSLCKVWLEPASFYPDPSASSGLYAQCKRCHTARNLATRDKARAAEFSREWRRRPDVAERERRRSAARRHSPEWQARIELNKAIKRGEVVRPSTCSGCGEAGRIEGHHHDYSKPFDVVWLCSPCHARHHAELRAAQETA